MARLMRVAGSAHTAHLVGRAVNGGCVAVSYDRVVCESGSDRLVPPEVATDPPAPMLVAPVFGALAVGLLVWTGFLAVTLPRRHVAVNWNVAWAGFDVALAVVLFLVAYGALRRRTWVQSAAAAAATLLVVDAWFDVVTAANGWDKVEAVALALSSELPLALVCSWIARNADRVSATARRYAVVSRRRDHGTGS